MADLSNQYNTRLSPPEEEAFQKWVATLPPNLRYQGDYDLRAAWLNEPEQAANGHLSDVGKKPNHMTFSDGSVHASERNPPGRWERAQDGTWTYYAPPTFTRYHDPSALLNYFQTVEGGARRDQSGRIVGYDKPNRVVLPPNVYRGAR